jgi:type IV secretory pathway VirB4 component
MMQSKVAANFLFQLIKRARKFGLWVTTITQDVEDFLRSEYGKPIVSNASLQFLLRQSTSSIEALEKTFWLSEAEKQLLVSANIGEWLMVAWNQHVGVKILASPGEKEFITTDVAR